MVAASLMRTSCAGAALALLGLTLGARPAQMAGADEVQAATAEESPSALCARIDTVVAKVRQRQLRSDSDTPWAILHGVVAFDGAVTVYDAESREQRNAVDFLLTRATHEGRRILRQTNGRLTLPRADEVEHHPDQFLMVFAGAGVAVDREFVADDGRTFRLADLVATSRRLFDEKQDLGWTLVALSTYGPLDERWTTAAGREYGIDDIVRLATRRDATREPEGGTHHMYGVAYALARHRKDRAKLTGAWREAEEYLKRHIDIVKRFQQPDGAFSDGLFDHSAESGSPSKLVFATGHMLEWLTLACSKNELNEAWIRRAVARLCREIERHPVEAFSDGGIYHAVHALRLYCVALDVR